MAKKKQQNSIPPSLWITCIVTGIAYIVLRLLNRQLHIPELGIINSYIGTAFAIAIVIIIGILLVKQVNAQS
ncbi:MAG TPA: hypothetical protein VL307_20310 [Chitinophagaceae bacterium]|nr:hypothetical protein [Chitinophagaceae bacterium]